MKLRIISGMLRGRFITIPDRDSAFRPTRERIRESVAAIVTNKIPCAVVADICAGSGAFGLEMVSRGAKRVVFVEKNKFRCRLIKKHAEQFGVMDKCSIIEQDVSEFIERSTDCFDIIYYDPPYDDASLKSAIPLLKMSLSATGVLIYERRSSEKLCLEKVAAYYENGEIRSYGDTEICIFKKGDSPVT